MVYNTSNIKILHQGIDTLVIGVNCTDEATFETKFKSFINKIRLAKQSAQELKTFGEKWVKSSLCLNYGDFFISSKGLNSYFGFVKNNDIFFSVSDTQFNTKSLYHLKLQFRSIYLLKYGHVFCMEQIRKFLTQIFDDKFEIKILRLDLLRCYRYKIYPK